MPVTNIEKRLKTIVGILVCLFIVTSALAIKYYLEAEQYKKDIIMVVKDVANRQHTIDDLNASNSKLEDELFWCKHANGQLLEHCDPSGVKKAIKATPLPKRV